MSQTSNFNPFCKEFYECITNKLIFLFLLIESKGKQGIKYVSMEIGKDTRKETTFLY